jgi:GNAT superfamily N-acetyltransferase
MSLLPIGTTIRAATDKDIAFIYSTWLKSYKDDSSMAANVRKSVFFDEYKYVIDHILLRAKVRIVCLEDQPNVILSYSVTESGIIHYLFTKEAFRGLGIIKALLQHLHLGDKVQYTHRTHSIYPILLKHKEYDYNPFVLFTKENK